jgi:hypothetical protein
MDAFDVWKFATHGVELGGDGDQGVVARVVQLVLLEGGAEHADAQGLGEDQGVALAAGLVGHHRVGMDQAQGDEAVDRLDAVDGMAAGHGDAGPRRTPRRRRPGSCRWCPSPAGPTGMPDDGQRQDRRAPMA